MTTAEKEMAETLKHNGQPTPLARGSSHGSADPQHHNNGTALFRHSTESGRLEKEYEAGCLPEQVYDHALSPWRAAVRRVLVASLRKESELMGRIQPRLRWKFLDRYFYWTAIFGTHTFFMAVLPMFFWFANDYHARGMLIVTGLGIWLSSVLKDLVCCPRPFSPPVIRLSMSTHGLEYGFPSSHATNSVSTALFIGSWLADNHAAGSVSTPVMYFVQFVLFMYAASVSVGRIYCGMHSTIDVTAGALLGALCCKFTDLIQEPVEAWVLNGGWYTPLVQIAVCLFLVHYHPEPVDDCPCFEDAIAILSVVLGSNLSYWWNERYRPDLIYGFPPHVSPFGLSGTARLAALALMAVLKVAIGVSLMFLWRLVMKRVLRASLPVIFRAFSSAFHFALPTRKHYTAATEYDSVPQPSFENPLSRQAIISALPEEMRLHNRAARSGAGATAAAAGAQHHLEGLVAANGMSESGDSTMVSTPTMTTEEERLARIAKYMKKKPRERPVETHYDVDVLTKVIVYTGVPIVALNPVRSIFIMIETLIGQAYT